MGFISPQADGGTRHLSHACPVWGWSKCAMRISARSFFCCCWHLNLRCLTEVCLKQDATEAGLSPRHGEAYCNCR